MERSDKKPLWEAIKPHYDAALMGPGFGQVFGQLYFVAWCLGAFSHNESNDLPVPRPALDLHPGQERSFWIIWDWWQAHKSFCCLEPGDSEQSLSNTTESTTSYRVHLVEGTPHVTRTKSPYSLIVIGLFQQEFQPDVETRHADISTTRRRAARYVACHVVALDCYKTAAAGSKVPGLRPLPEVDTLPEIDHHIRDIPAPVALVDSTLPGLAPRCSTGATVDPCPWLPDDASLPFYLWDRQSCCTIRVATLTEHPTYTAVSHTWGRWEQKRDGKTLMANVQGVSEWAVPRNILFDVEDISTIMSKIPTSTRYVWLDLVCIPQNRSQRAIEEIAKQAAIFQNAKHAIVWMNNVEDWSGLQSTISWMSLVFLGVDHVYLYECSTPRPDGLFSSPNVTGLLNTYELTSDLSSTSLTVCGWFSSLWTLQEICLRPDMLLCNKEWELLSTEAGGMPVAMDTLITLVDECSLVQDVRMSPMEDEDFHGLSYKPNFNDAYATNPPGRVFGVLCGLGFFHVGFLELFELFRRTGMLQLNQMTQKFILNLGSHRFCRERRADAIMSVIGVRAWSNNSTPETDLVMGQYPVSFVRHVAEAMGATFFDSLTSSTLTLPDIARNTPVRYRGSLMPFNAVTTTGSQVLEDHFHLYHEYGAEQDNPAVSDWVILVDGSVRVRRVGLLLSPCPKYEPSDPAGGGNATVMCDVIITHEADDEMDERLNPARERGLRFRRVELRHWLNSYHVDHGPNYAVELLRGDWGCRGVLLKKIDSEPPHRLIKLGNFAIRDRSPEYWGQTTMIDVDWLIL